MRAGTILGVSIAMLALMACSTNDVGLAYKSSAPVPGADDAKSPTVSVGTFVDQRGEPATWIGAIRGGFGNPVKTLEVTPSVSSVVQTAFSEGLRARHLLAAEGAGSYQISGVIKKLDCSQYERREAHAVIDVNVSEVSPGKKLFSQTYTADELEGSAVALNVGVFGSVESLRAVAEKALDEVVDKALDDKALRNSMRPSGTVADPKNPH